MARLDPAYVVQALMQRGVPQHVAQGVAMNFQDESGLNTGIQERNPTAGRGGYGIAQWTGPRRVALENYAASRGVSPDDPNMQFDFFMQENRGPEANAWNAVMASPDTRSAAQNFVRLWERPSAENMAARSTKYAANQLNVDPSKGGLPSDSNTAVAGGVGGFTPSAPGKPTETAKDGQDRFDVAETVNDLGSALTGSAGGRSSIPNVPMLKPAAYATEPQAAPTFNAQMMQNSRDRLAMAMARLNSGKLWVG